MVDFTGLERTLFDQDNCSIDNSTGKLELTLVHRYRGLISGLLYNGDEDILYVDMEVEYGSENETYFHPAPSITIPDETKAVKLKSVRYVRSVMGPMEHPYGQGFIPDILYQKRLES